MKADFITVKNVESHLFLPKIYRHLATISENGSIIASGSGFSLNRQSSYIAALGEAAERYCASQPIKELINENYKKISVTQITRQTSEYDDEPKRKWVTAINLKNTEKYLIPQELVYLNKTTYNEIRDIISTGLATHVSISRAIRSGINECIERDAFVLFWMLSHINFKIDITYTSNYEIKLLKDKVYYSGLEIELYDISTEFKTYVILCVIRKSNENKFYLGCAADSDPYLAIKKAMEEGIGGYTVYSEYTLIYNYKVPSTFENIKSLTDRPIFYLNHDTEILQWIINRSKNQNRLVKLDYDYFPKSNSFKDVVRSITKKYSIFYKDITRSNIEEIGLKVVRVIIPELAFLPTGYPMLLCNRLKRKKDEIGLDYNLIPHPFP